MKMGDVLAIEQPAKVTSRITVASFMQVATVG